MSNQHAITPSAADRATGVAASHLEIIHFGAEYCGPALYPAGAVSGEMEMNAQATKLQAAENDLKQLMADVARAMEKCTPHG
jgi:hypothetical protein